MRSAAVVRTLLAALALSLDMSGAIAEYLPGTPCPEGYSCFPAEPRDGVCQHPDVVLDEKMRATRVDGDRFSKQRERACIAKTSGSVARSGAGLRLKFDSGKSRLLKDEADCERDDPDAHCKLYSLYDYFTKDRLFLIHLQSYESDQWFLISQQSGREKNVVAPPGYSPSKQWLVSVYATEGTDDGNNGFDILPADFDSSKPAIHYRPNDYEMWEFVRWDGDNRLLLNLTIHEDGSSALVTRPAEVTLINGNWVLNKWSPR
jgi:hypothetical protein